jgi:hypothetical protein
VIDAARELDDVVDVGDVDALEPEPLAAFYERLAGRRGAIVIDAAQRSGRPAFGKVDRLGERVFRRVGSEQPADLWPMGQSGFA